MFRKKKIKIYFFVLPSMFCSLKKENFTLSQHYFSCIFELLKVLVQPPFQISKTMCNLVQPPNTKKDGTLLSIKVKIMPRPKHQVLKRQPLWLYWLLNVVFFIWHLLCLKCNLTLKLSFGFGNFIAIIIINYFNK